MNNQPFIWAYLLHLSFNFWNDRYAPIFRQTQPHRQAQPYLRCDDALWEEITQRMSDIGMNMLVIDVGDGIQFSSHPEIAVKGAWPLQKLREQLKRLRDLGIEPIPKLNFSTTHDVWLKEYGRMVSTPQYYQVCRDLIHETTELFGAPSFFHLGMDEETASHQAHNSYAVMRQHELWWHDLLLLADAVKSTGSKPWIWADYLWHHEKEFLQKMPRDIIQSNWYYGDKFGDFATDDPRKTYVHAYEKLEQGGYTQIPTASSYENDTNISKTVEHCATHLTNDALLGFLIAPWKITLPATRDDHLKTIEQTQQAMQLYRSLQRQIT